jgi:hypothetical protein
VESHIISTELAVEQGPLNDSKVFEGRVQRQSVAGRRCRRAQSSGAASTADLSAVRIEDHLQNPGEEDTEGLMGCGERPGALRGFYLPVCHSANKTRVIHTEDNPTPA